MTSLNNLGSDPHKFFKEITKKIRKEERRKTFRGPSKIFKHISRPLQKSSGPPSPLTHHPPRPPAPLSTYLMYGLLILIHFA